MGNSTERFYTTLAVGDWDLHRKGEGDRARHDQKVREILKENLPNVIAESNIIDNHGSGTYKVPVEKGKLDIPTFKFKRGQRGMGDGTGAGIMPGTDWYNVELTYDEISSLIFEDLGLPNLEKRDAAQMTADDIEWKDRRKSGPFTLIDKRATIRENLKRNAMKGTPGFRDIRQEDLRFRSYEPTVTPESNAVIIAMMDTSASMGDEEKYIAKAVYFWMLRYLRTKYTNVEIAFIAHHTEAKEVTEKEFFTRGESGGTKVSSALELSLDWIEGGRYSPASWNIYPSLFSDGDNWGEDNQRCVDLVRRTLPKVNFMGYGEIRTFEQSLPPQWRGNSLGNSTLMGVFSDINDPKFTTSVLKGRDDVLSTIRAFLPGESFEGREKRI